MVFGLWLKRGNGIKQMLHEENVFDYLSFALDPYPG